jgi:type VI secretion system protein ImpF
MEGAPAPLFDRLSIGTTRTERMLDRRSLRASVLRELTSLLNTRSCAEPAVAEGARGTVLDYGVPDISALAASSEPDQRFVAEIIEKRVAAYEPRLRDIRVTIDRPSAASSRVGVFLTASLRIGPVYEPVTFPISIRRENQRAGVAATATAESIAG